MKRVQSAEETERKNNREGVAPGNRAAATPFELTTFSFNESLNQIRASCGIANRVLVFRVLCLLQWGSCLPSLLLLT